MTLHEAAWQAHVQSQQDRTDQARALLADVLEPFDPTDLEVVHIDVTEGRTTMVFDAGNFFLATVLRGSGPGEVWLVEDDGGWTQRGRVMSLAQLGGLVGPPPAPPGETYPAWVQPSGAHDAYQTGDQVTYDGKVWESLIDGNVWAPGVSGWREVT